VYVSIHQWREREREREREMGVQNLYAASIGISPSKVPRLCGCVATDDKEEDDEEDSGEAR